MILTGARLQRMPYFGHALQTRASSVQWSNFTFELALLKFVYLHCQKQH